MSDEPKELSQSIVVAKSNLTLRDLLGLLQRGEVDAYVADRANLLSITSRDRRLKLLPIELTKDYLGIAVKKGNTELLKKINAALIKFKENGELKKLEAKWF
jgi:polar amino acid transport system substrate-binding protein